MAKHTFFYFVKNINNGILIKEIRIRFLFAFSLSRDFHLDIREEINFLYPMCKSMGLFYLAGVVKVIEIKTDNMKKTDKHIEFSPPDMSELEIAEVVEALRSGWITTGLRTKLLERRLAAYIETANTTIDCENEENKQKYTNRVVCLNSATAAEELNLRILGVGPGDEVIVPAYTYTSTASAVIHVGAKVVFVDSQPNNLEMDYDAMEKAITPRTKAIIPVDLGGIMCNYDRIYDVVQKMASLYTPMKSEKENPLSDLSSRIQRSLNRIAVLSDAAHALGASYKDKNEGEVADFTSFSFHAVKNFTTAEGGASTWRTFSGIENSEIYHFFQLLSLHGQNKDALAKTRQGSWEYDIIGPWYKCNMTDIMAAIGLRQLDRYKEMLERREKIINQYNKAMDEIGVEYRIHRTKDIVSSNHLYQVRVPGIGHEERCKIIKAMSEQGVACNVHFKPLILMSGYQNLGADPAEYPNAINLYQNEISLPIHTLMSNEDVDYVIEKFQTVVKEYL